MAYTIKKNDTLPNLVSSLTTGPTSGSQSAVNLAGASVVLVMRSTSGGVASRLGATITDAPNGTVARIWEPADTATSGTFNGEWEVTFSPNKVQTFPNESYFTITIADDLG